jgi:hypothetical protein
MKNFIFDPVFSHKYTNTMVQFFKKSKQKLIDHIFIYVPHILDWSCGKNGRDSPKGFRIIALCGGRDNSLILQNISVMSSKSVIGS